MQKLTLAAIGAASLLAVPAFAQSSNSQAANAATSSSSMNSSSSMSHMNLQQVRQKITKDLRSDGYQDIRVIPDSFLVHAKNKQGDPVVMIINPDSVFAVTKLPGSQANASNPNGTSNGTSSLGNSSNSSNTTTKQ